MAPIQSYKSYNLNEAIKFISSINRPESTHRFRASAIYTHIKLRFDFIDNNACWFKVAQKWNSADRLLTYVKSENPREHSISMIKKMCEN